MSNYSFTIRDQPNSPDHVFGLATPGHMLRKLGWEIRRFKASLVTAPNEFWGVTDLCYLAFNTAVTAFHCSDWAWRALEPDTKAQIAKELGFSLKKNDRDNLVRFTDAIRGERRSIDICRSIANGSKHMGASAQPNSPFSVSTVWSFRADSDVGRTDAYLAVQDGDEILRVENVFDDAFLYWERAYGEWGFIEGRYAGSE